MQHDSINRLVAHEGRVTAIAISPTANVVATGSVQPRVSQNQVRVWETKTWACVHTLVTAFDGIYSLAVSPDGEWLAVGGGGIVQQRQRTHAGGIEIWSLRDFSRVATFGESRLITKSLAFSTTSELLASGHQGPDVESHFRVWKRSHFSLWRSGAWKKVLGTCDNESVISVAWSQDSKVVYSASGLSSLPKVTVPRSKLQEVLSGRDGVTVPSTTTNQDSIPLIHVWNLTERRPEAPFDLSKGLIQGLAISSDGKWLAVCGSKLSVWDLSARKILKVLEDDLEWFSNCVAFSPKSGLLACGTGYQREMGSSYENSGVRLWNVITGNLVAFFPHSTPVYSLAFMADTEYLIAGDESGELRIWAKTEMSVDR